MVTKVLVPTDGSEYSLRAVEQAAKLKKLNPSLEITIFTVHNVPKGMSSRRLFFVSTGADKDPQEIGDAYAQDRRQVFEKAESVLQQHGFTAETAYGAGNPAEVICQFAREKDFGLIIMGPRGRGGLQGLFMGSVSSKVLALAPCPVLLAKS